VHLQGPSVILAPQTAVSVAMAAHELCTNAIKYGALSTEAGRVAVRWSIHHRGGAPHLNFEWLEEGGPPVAMPARRGFGSRLIERGLASELRGKVHMKFLPTGLRCTLDAPLPPYGSSGS
jgi:two-component sensor histidine kinase